MLAGLLCYLITERKGSSVPGSTHPTLTAVSLLSTSLATGLSSGAAAVNPTYSRRTPSAAAGHGGVSVRLAAVPRAEVGGG